ncbi:MAG: hypothetical protein VB074_04980 [Proteiniphilum sp.]|uniref:hypothetical protein n=1 Tax=Proteiniphilum sp. TaxID=1926877 RepID=UPI002B1F4EB6|nr:hypothetical protein [Proteiniphilum sp.]MEA5127515.1 hypothetical protein [Proteiniphilum sp.]
MKSYLKSTTFILIIFLVLGSIVTSCGDDAPEPYLLQKGDITVNVPAEGFIAEIDQLFKIEVVSVSDEGLTYEWFMDGESVSKIKTFEYMFDTNGVYDLNLVVKQGELQYEYPFTVKAVFSGTPPPPIEGASPYITKVIDYMPAVGQFTNKLPKYEEGDTQEIMNEKVLAAIGNNKKGMITLGGYGGYVVVGFDHTIQNIKGKRDFRVLGNAFYANTNPDPDAPEGGSFEPGIIMVAYDKNKNGIPDDDEWYEIAGSAHEDPTKELWYEKAKSNGNDVNLYRNYEITYYKPDENKEPVKDKDQAYATDAEYIKWKDNQDNTGYKVKNIYHQQSYYPQWATGDELTFRGTCLPQNGVDESGKGNYFVLYKFHYGYADNEINNKDDAAMDIDWAINSKGQKVNLPGVDFIKIYTGVNQENGWLGENSTEISGVEDLHLLQVDIDTRK